MPGSTLEDVHRPWARAFGEGDVDAVVGLYAEFFSLLSENLEFERFEAREFVAQGDTVVVLGEERSLVKPTGRAFENEWAHVYTLRDGKIAKGRFFEDTAAQVVAFGAAQEGGGGGTSSDAASETTSSGTGVGPKAAAGQPTGA